ncbi:unannotated protein [freshwater metagenome]|uniref:Unannotated protein n=1 Tax=freshwater metagenome TaxID=449393 RepID=A0A6J6DMR3_9ZZZZ
MHELLQHTVFDQHIASSSEAFTISIGRCKRAHIGGIVDQSQQRGTNGFTQTVGKQRPSLEHRLPIERVSQNSQELRGDPRVEHNGQATAGRLHGTKHPCCT